MCACVCSMADDSVGWGRRSGDVGADSGTPVSEDYSAESSRFTGTVNLVELQIGDDSHDHLIAPEELMRVATSIQ